MVLGYGNSISYDQLVQRITGDTLDKSHRFTDWTRRPLSDAQIAYALSDVTHLRDVYLKLATDLDKRGRTNWVEAEMEVLTSPETYRADPERAWERLKSRCRARRGGRRRRAEEDEVARTKRGAACRMPGSRLVPRVARNQHSAHAEHGRGEAGAVEAEARCPRPEVGEPDETACRPSSAS